MTRYTLDIVEIILICLLEMCFMNCLCVVLQINISWHKNNFLSLMDIKDCIAVYDQKNKFLYSDDKIVSARSK